MNSLHRRWSTGTTVYRHDPELLKRVIELRERLQISTRYARIMKIEEAA